MKALKQENLKELTEKVYELLNQTAIEIGHKADGKTLAALSKIFAQDLIQEKRFGNMSWNQEPFLNVRTFYRWTYAHKKVIDNAWYEVHTLGKPKEETLYYQEPLKLLK